jgi:hypothetical protein
VTAPRRPIDLVARDLRVVVANLTNTVRACKREANNCRQAGDQAGASRWVARASAYEGAIEVIEPVSLAADALARSAHPR